MTIEIDDEIEEKKQKKPTDFIILEHIKRIDNDIKKVGKKYPMLCKIERMKKNGKEKIYIRSEENIDIFFEYDEVVFDLDGWADSKKFLPRDYELCSLKIEGKKTKMGWHSGNQFDGARITQKDKVLYWKRSKEL